MNIYEFGNKENPIIMLFPGTMCCWKGNFGKVIEKLSENFLFWQLRTRGLMKLMQDPDPYNRAFVAMTGRDKYNMSFITKESLINQFRSDLITPFPEQIDNGEMEIHVFYAKKMGEKYLERYKKYFKDSVIHEQDMRYEEMLGVYPENWCSLVEKICL